MYRVKTRIELPMAHCLNEAFSGLCVGNVGIDDIPYELSNKILPITHGHNNFITVILTIDDFVLDKNDMVLDFKLFKKILHSHFDKYDHSLVLHKDNILCKLYKNNFKTNKLDLFNTRLFIIGNNPTSEILSTYWYYELLFLFYSRGFLIKNLEIIFEETNNNSCSFTKEKINDIDNTICGIYRLYNKLSKKAYIGQSIDIVRRWKQELFKKLSVNKELDEDIKKSRIEDWDCSILEICDPSELSQKETEWINFYNTVENGYNCQFSNTAERQDSSLGELISLKRKKMNKACKNWRKRHPDKRRAGDKKREHYPAMDPIKGDICSYASLQRRMQRNPDLYINCYNAAHYILNRKEYV